MEMWRKLVILKLLCFVLINLRGGLTGETTWHIGCVVYNSTQTVELSRKQGSPLECFNFCLSQSFSYAGLQSQECVCFHELPGYLNVSQDQCTEICGTLPCGGNASLSLYAMYGPYIHSIRLRSASINQINAETLYEAKIYLASDYFEPTGIKNVNATHLENIYYTWYLNGSVIAAGSKSVKNNSALVAFLHKIDKEGHYIIDLVVNNTVSQLNASTVIDIVPPYPAVLQVTLSPGQHDVPSCIPLIEDLDPTFPAVSVFVNESTAFEASLVRGINITFSWQFGNEVVYSEPGRTCMGLECLQDSQVYTFVTKGIISVSVNATNYLGTVSKTLNVVILDKSISNLTIDLAGQQITHHKVNTTIYYLLILDTAARAVSTLSVDFGDGCSYSQPLRDINDTFISGGSSSTAHLHLSASYGEGCRLFVSLDHIYRWEGRFEASVEVANDFTVESASMLDTLVIQNEIDSLDIVRSTAYRTGEPFNISVALAVPHWVNVTLRWWLRCGDSFLEIHSQNNWQSFTIDKPGRCNLNVTAENAVSSRSSHTQLFVQDAINLSRISADKVCMRPGDSVTFSAWILQGSNLTAVWDFGDGTFKTTVLDKIFPCLISHEYMMAGTFNVSLRLQNLVDEVTVYLGQELKVLESIEGMIIYSAGPTLVPSATFLEVSFTKGTGVGLTISTYGATVPSRTQPLDTRGYLVEFNLTEVGVHLVNVTASNAISSSRKEYSLLIERDVGDISVDILWRSQDYLLLAKENGVPPDRSDLVYSWLHQQTDQVTQLASPCLVVPNGDEQLQISFNLTVFNQVRARWVLVTLDPVNLNQLSLSHPVYGEVGKDINFEAVVDDGASVLDVQFGDGQSLSVPINAATFACSHVYVSPAIYKISLSFLFSNGESSNSTSVVSIEERILDLKLDGPEVSAYIGPSSSQDWTLLPTGGTNIVYKWRLELLSNPLTTLEGTLAGGRTKMYLPFTAAGSYNVTVTASNSISSVSASATTLLQEPIKSLNITCKPTLIGTRSEICIEVEGSTPLEIEMDYGDMVVDNWSSEDEEIQIKAPAELAEDAMQASHTYSIWRSFSSLGEQSIKVTVKNAVSSRFRHHVVLVEDRVTGLEVTSNTSWLVDILFPVKMFASVKTGSDVVFEWDFYDSYGLTTVESNGTFSEAVHRFGLPGEYNVSVRATNGIQGTPVEVTYGSTFSVLEAIFGLDLVVQDQSRKAALFSVGNVWQTSQIIFRANCWGSDVSFAFDFGDGTRLEKKVTVGTSYGIVSTSVVHRFIQEGEYAVSVTASNLLNNVTTVLAEPFVVQIPPTEVRFEKNFYAYRFGEVSQLSVQLDFGSQVAFNWSMGDQTDYIDAPSQIQHTYHSVGTFIVTVVAFNKVHYSQTSCYVAVQNPLQGVELLTGSLLVAAKSEIKLEARTVGDSAQWFDWDVGDNRNIGQTSKPTLTFSYRDAGIYYVTVLAGNHVSNVTSPPLQLVVEASISRLEIHLEDDVSLIGTTTILAAQTYSGSSVKYIWNFGDSTPEFNTHQAVVNHNYNSTGVYNVWVSGYNQVSNKSATARIFVLEEMCHPPSLELFGLNNHLFQQSEDIRLEAEVKIDCEVTNKAEYKWMLNGSHSAFRVPAKSRANYLERRTMFIPRRTLDVGTYTVSLLVQMNGTIVFNTITMILDVIHSDLVSVIEGGTLRFVHKDDWIILNGGLSYDPDDLTSTLSYKWNCLQIESDQECFDPPGLTNVSKLLPKHNATICFPAAWLLHREADYFVFSLEVSKPGRTPVETYQVIRIYPETTVVDLSVDCPDCESGIVNSNNLLTLESLCHDCNNNTIYDWKLYYVEDGNTGQHSSASRCVQARGISGSDSSQSSDHGDSNSLSNGHAGESADEFGKGHVTTTESTKVRSATGQISGTVSSVPTSTIHTQSSFGSTPISGPTSNSVLSGNEAYHFSEYQSSLFEEYDAEYFSSSQLDEVIVEPTQRVTAVSSSTASLLPSVLSSSPSSSSSPTIPPPERVPSTPHITDEEPNYSYQESDFYEFLSSSKTNDGYEEYEEIGDVGTTLAIMTTTAESQESIAESASDFLSYAEDVFRSSSLEGAFQYISSDSYQESADSEVGNRAPSTPVMMSASRGLPDNSYPSGGSLAEGILSSVEDVSGGDYGSVVQEHYSDYPEEYIGDHEASLEEDIDVIDGDDSSVGEMDAGNQNGQDTDYVADDNQSPVFGKHLISKDLQEVPLMDHQTLTGLSASTLTIRDGVLQEGRTYAVGLKVAHPDGGKGQEGNVYQYFRVNESPKWGTCTISPVRGRELDTFFTTNCQEWQDEDLPLWFEIRYSLNESEPDTVLYFGMNYAVQFLLPAGYQDNDYNVYLKLSIVDSKGGKTSVCDIAIKVEPNYQVRGHHDEDGPESVESYLYLLTVAPDNDLSVLLDQGDTCSAHAFVRIVTHVLNELEDHQGTSVVHCDHYYHRCKIRRILIEAIAQLPIRDSLEVQQTSQALAAVLKVTPEISEQTLRTASNHLLQLVRFCCLLPERELDFTVFTSTLSSIAAVYDSLEKHFHDQMHIDHEISCKETTYQTLKAESKIINLFTSIKLDNTGPLTYSNPLTDVVADRVTRLDGLTLTTKDVDITFPYGFESFLNNMTEVIVARDSCFNVGLSGYHMNPLHWGNNADKVTTGVASANVYPCGGKDPFDVRSLPHDQAVTVKIMNFCSEDKVSCNFTFDPNYMNIHQFNLTEDKVGQDLHILVTMRQGKKQSYPVNVLLRYDASPYPDEYDAIWVYTEESMVLDIFLSGESLNDTGTYHLALVDGELGEPVYREESDIVRPYSLTMWWGQCLSWSFEKDEWTSEGCSEVPSQNHFVTECKCDHLGIHGVSFFPVTTHIEQKEVSLLLVNPHNPIVYTVYGVILGVYLVLFLYCYLTDRHDYDKPGLIFLKDNHPMDKQYYEVSFETGSRPGAGTTATVSLVIRGKDGHSETKELINNEKPTFERNSRDRFIISVPEALGSITSLLIWHNNGGISPGWYLSRVCVRDLITGRKWFFVCEQWFAVEEDDGQIERELKVITAGIGFQKAFFAKGAQYFSDYYIWSSVFTRPPYSVFTRVQRLTCCYAICMGFMCVNTLWYQTVNERTLNLSIIDISGEAIMVGILTALVAIPINFPIIMLFRRAKPLRMPGEIGELYKYVGTSNELQKAADATMANVPSEARWDAQLFDQTAETFRNLQKWAWDKWEQKPKNVMVKEWRDDYVLAEEVTEETSCSSGFEDCSSSNKDSPTWNSPHRDEQRRQVKGQRSKGEHKKLHQPKIWLPRTCYFIAWGSCVVVILMSSVITLGLGHLFSYKKAIFWMQAFYFSFMQCFFITQPFVMAMFTVAKAWKDRNNIKLFDHYDDNTDLLDPAEIANERWQNHELQIQNGIEARQRARYLRFSRPPQSEELEKAKEKMQKEKNMFAIFWDVILFSTGAFCLMWIAYGKDMHLHYPINKSILDKFVRTPYPFSEVRTVNDLWYWMENDLLDELFVDEWNVNQFMNGTRQSESQILGKVSLRQVRVDPGCSLSSVVQDHMESCKPWYNRASQSREPFGPGRIWRHSTKQELIRYSKWGMMSSYGGDGYTIELNNTRVGAEDQLVLLQDQGWIDHLTRAVIIEFTMYNAPANIFSSVALLAEMPGTGAIYPFPKVESVLLYRYQTAYDYFIMGCEFLFLLLTAVSAKQEVQRAVKLKSKYFSDVWAWLEICKVLLSLTFFAMYVYRFAHVTDITHRLRETYMQEFVDMSFLAYWDQCVRDLIGWLVFIVSFKFFHLFRFNKMVAKFGAVIDATMRDILAFLLSYLLLEASFACLGCLLFGVYYYPMKQVFLAVEVVTILILGGVPDYPVLRSTFPLLWPLYHILYLFILIILFGGMMKAVLCSSYRKVKETHKVEPVGGYEVFIFFWQHLLHQLGILKEKEEEKPFKLPLEFNLAEMEYQVEELLFRMESVCDTYGVSKTGEKDLEENQDGRDDGISTCSADENLCESLDEKFEEQFFNPEIRDYLQLNRESDDEEEQDFRDKLTMEIVHRLQRDQMKDSGQETLSPSNVIDEDDSSNPIDSDRIVSASSRVVRNNGKITFPEPVENIGSLEEQTFDKWQRQAWSESSSHFSTVSSPEPYSSGGSSRSNLTPDIHEPGIRLDYLEQCKLELRVRSAWKSPWNPPEAIVRDSEEGEAAAASECNPSIDSFPLPNMLDQVDDSSTSDCENMVGKSASSKSQTRKLRKTKTRGKGRGRLSLQEGSLSDEEDIPVIALGPQIWSNKDAM